MELLELTEKTKVVFNAETIQDLQTKIFEAVSKNDYSKYEKFLEIVENDLSVDYIQKIYQYYIADRKEKKQDFTPESIGKMVAKLAGDTDVLIDMCAGSGSLTIQCWNVSKAKSYELYELDENVITFLLFNMALRNIECVIHQCDVLNNIEKKTYKIEKGEKFGIYKEVK